jgi:hypothetical protein
MRHQAADPASPDGREIAAPWLRRPSDTDGDRKQQTMRKAHCKPPHVGLKRQAFRACSSRVA